MKKANVIILSLFFSLLTLSSVVHADLIFVPSVTSDDTLNLLLIAALIIIAIIAGLVIRKIKKNNDSKREPKIKA